MLSIARVSLAAAFLAITLASESRCLSATLAWTEYSSGKISAGTTSGGTATTIHAGSAFKDYHGGLTFDPTSGYVYWANNYEDPNTEINQILRAKVDGSGFEQIITAMPAPGARSLLRSVALDTAANKIYWTDAGDFGHDGFVMRADLNGTNPQTLATIFQPDCLALDVIHQHIYFTDSASVLRANLDGTDVHLILSAGEHTDIYGLAIDPNAGWMYLSERLGARPEDYSYKIVRATLGGTGTSDLITAGLNDTRNLAIDPPSGLGYGAQLTPGNIIQFPLDGRGPATVVISGLEQPFGVALVPEPMISPLLIASLTLWSTRRGRRPG
jgi:hypothetical protein